MLRLLVVGLIIASVVIISVSASDNGFSHCHCDDEGLWSIQSILECQKVSDFLIAVAYFSIPLELLYFVNCSNVPFKWVLLQFIAFIVLCGLTHLLNGWTYYGPHSFQLMLALTIAKFLTALVSCATAITLLTLILLLLKWKVSELFLKQNVLELDQEVGMMRPYSVLGAASSGGYGESIVVAAIRIPMPRVSNFKEGTPELVETRYAILVLVLPTTNHSMCSSIDLLVGMGIALVIRG